MIIMTVEITRGRWLLTSTYWVCLPCVPPHLAPTLDFCHRDRTVTGSLKLKFSMYLLLSEDVFMAGGWGEVFNSRTSMHWATRYGLKNVRASQVAQMVNNLPAMRKTWVQALRQEDPLEKGMATHSSILAWKIPWTEEPGELQSMQSHRVGHDWSD